MNLCVCTISFRHQLISLEQIAAFAARHGFQGIELWGVHAQNLCEFREMDAAWLRARGLFVPMVSDYLPLEGERASARERAIQLCRTAQSWGAGKLRTFAGSRGSASVGEALRRQWVLRLREFCVVAEAHGVSLVIETHPGTLADKRDSIVRLADEVNHPALRFNFDVLHVWEGGSDPIDVWQLIEPLIAHVHLKNVSAREMLSVFAPPNVYAPSGSRQGMIPLFEGSFDYSKFVRFVCRRAVWEQLDASLEWFGSDVLGTLERDSRELRLLEARHLKSDAFAGSPRERSA